MIVHLLHVHFWHHLGVLVFVIVSLQHPEIPVETVIEEDGTAGWRVCRRTKGKVEACDA